MDDTPGLGGRHRSLTITQTLDEILGVGPKNDTYGINSTIRPPTRHGRESTSSEENKEPTPTDSLSSSAKLKESFSNDTFDDDFLSKLNEMRKRTQIEKQENSSEKKLREVIRQPSGIQEEDEDDPHNASKTRDLLRIDLTKMQQSRPTSTDTEGDDHTFRIEEELKKKEVKLVSRKKTEEKIPSRLLENRSNSIANHISSSGQHKVWLEKKLEDERRKKKLEKEKEENEKKNKEEKKKIAAKQFEAWKANRDHEIKEQKRVEKEKNLEKQRVEEESKKQRRVDAQKTFEAWKTERLRTILDEKTRTKEEEEDSRRRKQRANVLKKTEAHAAFDAWARQKQEEEDIRKLILEKQLAHERRKMEIELQEKELLAEQAYQTWLQFKEIEKLDLRSPSVMSTQSNSRTPWVPPSNTVPRHFVSTGNRRRSLDKRIPRTPVNRMHRSYSAKNIFTGK
ncbi:unnamed protein product [Auanema sp. JU1783]|nr:unnamed protein product [Auanema sp. JU1783]